MGKFDGFLIASDLDGTLLGSDKRLSGENRAAIEYFKGLGGYFTVSTGRAPESFRLPAAFLPFNAPVVMCNGAIIYDYQQGEVVYVSYMEEGWELVGRIVAMGEQVAVEIYRLSDTFLVHPNEVSLAHLAYVEAPYTVAEAGEVAYPWLKILITGPPDDMDRVLILLSERYPEYSYVKSEAVFVEVCRGGIDKGTGVLRLAGHLGVAREKIFTVGDHGNDIDMLKVAAVSFAPENGSDEAKAAADVILPGNDDHTIRALVEYLDENY